MAKFELSSSLVSKDFLIDFVQNTLSLEGKPVCKETVNAVFEDLEADVNEKEKKSIINAFNAFSFILNLLENKEELDENKLKDLHEIIMDGFGNGGLYRNVDISIKGSNHTPPSHIKVYDRMKKYFDTINQDGVELYEQIAFSHLQLAKIHPFLDGNGRCARLVLNYNLLKNSLKPIIIEASKKDEYFNYLEEFKVNKDITPFINFLKNNQ